MCVGFTGQMVATSIFKPFLVNVTADDRVASFGEYFMEEDKVIIDDCPMALSSNHVN